MSNLPEFGPDDEVSSEVIEHPEATNERSLSRRVALQVLYEIDSTGHLPKNVIAVHLATQDISGKSASYLRRLVMGVLENKKSLDSIIQEYAPEWPLDQVAIVDRNILRMAILEFLVESRTPVGVAIDEAVALAQLFGADGSTRFVNGVLGAVSDNAEQLRERVHSTGQSGEAN